MATRDSKESYKNKNLKIFDFITYTKKEDIVSKRKELRGRVCTTLDVPKLKDMRKNILKDIFFRDSYRIRLLVAWSGFA